MRKLEPALRYRGGDVPLWQEKLRPRVRELLGDWPEKKCPLRVRTIWKQQHAVGMIEKIVFTSEPGSDVCAYVCLPDSAPPPYRFVICLQGHTSGMHNSIAVRQDDESQPFQVEGDRDFAIGCMKRGMAALCIEQRSFGERGEKARETLASSLEVKGSQSLKVARIALECQDAVLHALLLGRTLLGERVWDVERGLDYLESRGDADRNQIGVMGNSTGGTVSIYAAALIPRIAYAMPSCAFCTFEGSLMFNFHCGCDYVPGILKVAEMADVLGLFAPKPVVVVTGEHDPLFPIRGVHKAFENLQQIYAAAGAGDRCKLVIGQGGHRFYAKQSWEALLPMINNGFLSETSKPKPQKADV